MNRIDWPITAFWVVALSMCLGFWTAVIVAVVK
jgi:hypothetical protein